MQVADSEDVAALEWLELELRTADARRRSVTAELAAAISVVASASGDCRSEAPRVERSPHTCTP